jgi:hypothetical protein
MRGFLETLFSSDFAPHGYCYSWNAALVWLHVISDLLIALAYFSIPVTLVYFIRKRRVKFGAQYTGYTRFNGQGTNYDGSGRKASANNSIYLIALFTF